MENEEEIDRLREATIASTPCLQPNFKPKGVITQDHLSKFRELHKRRLQLKSKSKSKTKSKDGSNKKSKGNDLSSQNCGAQGLKLDSKEPNLLDNCEAFDSINKDSKDSVSALSAPKKRKLHWGNDHPGCDPTSIRNIVKGLTPRRGGRGNPTCRYYDGTAVRDP